MRYAIRIRSTRLLCRSDYSTSPGLTATRRIADDSASSSLSTGDSAADVSSRHHRPRAPIPRGPPPLRPTTFEVCIGLAVLAGLTHLLMKYDESLEPDRIAKRAREYAAAQESLSPLSRQEWDSLQSAHPHTPFDSRIPREGAQIRTERPMQWDEVRRWSLGVISNAAKERENSVLTRPK